MDLVLASASPRRRRFLETLGFAFTIAPAHIEEKSNPGESPKSFVRRAALDKLAAVQPSWPHHAVIAADTIVVSGNSILGKPDDAQHARQMLRSLSARWHRVLTCVVLATPTARAQRTVQSLVKFRALSDYDLAHYVTSGEPMNKAGAYALQGMGSMLIERIEGSCSNVAGFPVEAFLSLVEEILGAPWTKYASQPSNPQPLWP